MLCCAMPAHLCLSIATEAVSTFGRPSIQRHGLQVKALVAVLPVRLKILDVAGSAGSIYTFEPPSTDSSPSTAAASSAQHSMAGAPHRQGSRPDVQKLWLIYRPGHYEIVYPAEGCEDLEKP